ncbi:MULTISPECIES: FecR family protein [Methylomonas]|uniref:FecR family protein n=1 Tax=Methylomonas TaxID=416 RepID=UPI000B2A1E73|nr:FecR family protein [Methylomonas koyamae]
MADSAYRTSDADAIANEAAHWVARLESSRMDEHERRAFMAWIKQSPEHRARFFEMRKHWQGLSSASSAVRTRTTAFRAPALRYAAAILLAVGLLSWHFRLPDRLQADFATAPGESKTVQLSDGSTLYLNADTALAIAFTPQGRQIRLLRGEVECRVAHDSHRPFAVVTGPDRVTALGTDFSVYRDSGQTTVSVFESTVQIEHADHLVGVLNPGQQQHLDDETGAAPLVNGVGDDARAWRYGQLVFTAKSLTDVIAELNRYRPGKLVLMNRTAAQRKVSGVFNINDLETAIQTIANTQQLRTVRLGAWLTAIY